MTPFHQNATHGELNQRFPKSLSLQRGAALITALLVITLATTLAVYLLSQQSRALTRTARTTDRAQLQLYVGSVLDYARAFLFENQKNYPYVSLNQPWARGLSAIPVERAVASGLMADEQAKFNLNNLVNDGKRSNPDIALFMRLLVELKLNPDLASAVLDWIDADSDTTYPGGAEDLDYLSQSAPQRAANRPLIQVEELYRIKGFDTATVKRLRPFVTALPVRTRININTASQEVLTALFPPSASEKVVELIKYRETKPFTKIDDLKAYLKDSVPDSTGQFVDTNSDFFVANIALTAEATQIRQMALLRRQTVAPQTAPTEWPAIIWVRDF
ncbi:MAG: type II secretion system minor pseudopilin GspK [Betaproteobacteria bacterium]|nr:type II secretion system minor pseudopilin GspK [Betaproteobacteria bacterium]